MKRTTMVKFALALALTALLSASTPVHAQFSGSVHCNQSAIYDTNTNGATRLVTAKSGKQILICGFVLFGGGTANVGFVSGTGTNCGSSQANVTPQFNLTAQARIADQSPVFRGLIVGPTLDLCIKSSAGVAVQGIIYFNQD